VVAWSCGVHIIICVGIPLYTYLFYHPEKFERPQTFQLVSMPAVIRQSVPVSRPQSSPSAKSSTPIPAKKMIPAPAKESTPAQSEDSPPEENLDELASLLNEMPSPMEVSANGSFKYPWYLLNVQQKTERFWQPPFEDEKLSVIISFVIIGDGTVTNLSVTKTSGNATVDNMAMRAVTLAAPFGKLPPGFSGDKLELNCTLRPVRR
jgi:TonB family protein